MKRREVLWHIRLIGICVLLVLTVIYAAVVAQAVHSLGGIYYGIDEPQGYRTVVVVAFLLLILFLAAYRMERFCKYWIRLLITAVTISAFLLPFIQDPAGFLGFLWLMVAGIFVGYGVSSLFQLTSDTTANLHRLAVSFFIALGLWICVGLFLAVASLVSPLSIIVVSATLIFLFRAMATRFIDDIRYFYRSLWNYTTHQLNYRSAMLVSVVVASAVIIVIQVLAPEIQFDALYYQLSIPAAYADAGRLVEMPYTFRSYFPKGINMLYMLGFVLGETELIPKLFNLALFACLCLSLVVFMRRRHQSHEITFIALALFMTIPMVGWSTGTGNVDIGMAAFNFAAIYGYFEWRQTRKKGWAIYIGFVSGLAIFAKVQAINILLPLGVSILFDLYRDRSIKDPWKQVFNFFVPALITGAPWYVITYLWTGNPVFPLFNNLFQSPYWAPVNETFNMSTFGTEKSLFSLLALPWNITFHSDWYIESIFGKALLGLVPLLSIVGIALTFKSTSRIISLLFISSLIIWALMGEYIRYLISFLVIGSIISAYGAGILLGSLRTEDERRLQTGFQFLVSLIINYICLLSIIMLVNMWWNVPSRVPWRYTFGLQSRPEYLEKSGLREFETLRANPNAVTLAVGIHDFLRLGPATRVFPAADRAYLLRWLLEGSEAEFHRRLDALGITNIAINFNMQNYLTADEFFENFMIAHLRPQDVQGDNVVFWYERKRSAAYPDLLEPIYANDFETSSNGEGNANGPALQCDEPTLRGCVTRITDATIYQATINVDGNEPYLLSWSAHPNVDTGRMQIIVEWFTDENGSILTKRYNRELMDIWGRYFIVLEVPTEATSIQVSFQGVNSSPILVDNISLIPLIPAPPNEPIASEANHPSAQWWNTLYACIIVQQSVCEPG